MVYNGQKYESKCSAAISDADVESKYAASR